MRSQHVINDSSLTYGLQGETPLLEQARHHRLRYTSQRRRFEVRKDGCPRCHHGPVTCHSPQYMSTSVRSLRRILARFAGHPNTSFLGHIASISPQLPQSQYSICSSPNPSWFCRRASGLHDVRYTRTSPGKSGVWKRPGRVLFAASWWLAVPLPSSMCSNS